MGGIRVRFPCSVCFVENFLPVGMPDIAFWFQVVFVDRDNLDVMEQAVEDRAGGGYIAEQFAPSMGRLEVIMPGWVGKTVSIAPQVASLRLTWRSSNGALGVWELNDSLVVVNSMGYGPFTGWEPGPAPQPN
jgi:hypothetical protein